MFAYNRNYTEVSNSGEGDKEQPRTNVPTSENNESDGNRYKVFTLEYLIKRLLDYGEEQGEARVR